jgi:hypothetical protein
MKRTDVFEQYSGETLDELLAYPSKGQYGSLARAFEQAIQQKVAQKGKDGLTKEEYIVLAVRALDREVNNGGYDQFFCNSSRQYASTIVDALRQIGCDEAASITQRALGALSVPSLDPDSITKAITKNDNRRTEELYACDRLFYQKHQDIAKNLYLFVKRNKTRIEF